MRGSRKFCQRRSTFDNAFFFSLMRGGMIQIPLLPGHLNGVCWRADDGPTLKLCDFSGDPDQYCLENRILL